LSLIARVKLETCSLFTHEFLERLFIQTKHIRYFDRPLAIKLDIVSKLFPNILVIKHVLKERHDFGELTHLSSGATLTIDNPATRNNPATFGLDLAFFHKEDSPEDSVFEK
jgi:hypothetical protein